jgi:polysaccharide biosynthesis protein PslG
MRKVVALALAATIVSSGTAPLYAAEPDESAFQRVWERTDGPVASGSVARTWYWGPAPLDTLDEEYVEGTDGTRRVQYWDKGRMEIGNPNDDPADPWYVSSGLLVKELIAGRMQMGDDTFERKRAPQIPIAGDPDDNEAAPTYVSWARVSSINLDTRLVPVVSDPIGPIAARNGEPPRFGDLVAERLNRDGEVEDVPELAARYSGTRIVYWDGTLAHNIPQVFYEFLLQSGRVSVNGAERQDVLVDWVYMMGYPISEPFWVLTKVGGVETDVLVQAFERRVLTYTPTNDPAYQVQMGNIGQHYYRWRYEPVAAPPVAAQPANVNAEVTPPQGPAGTEFTARLFGFEPGEEVSLWLTFPDQSVLDAPQRAVANDEGVAVFNGSPDIGIQTSENGDPGVYALTGQGLSSGRVAVGYFSVTP